MRRLPFLLCLLGLLTACANAPVHASTTIVPGTYATIQAAMNAGIDTIYVNAGTYNETVSITHAVYLAYYLPSVYTRVPVVLRVAGTGISGNVKIEGLHILRGASVGCNGTCEFASCRSDSGISASALGDVRVHGCTVFGDLRLSGAHSLAVFNTVSGGRIQASAIGSSPIAANFVSGAPGPGIILGEDCYATDNLVRGCVTGISVAGCSNSGASSNVVEDCAGTGIVGPNNLSMGCDAYCLDNTVRRCGGIGIEFRGRTGLLVDGNSVDSTGGTGIVFDVTSDHVDNNRVTRAGGHGIDASWILGHIRGNTVLRCAGDGIHLRAVQGKVDHNIAGRNGGVGIYSGSYTSHVELRSNTCYENVSYGIDVPSQPTDVDSVCYNIGFGNSFGLHASGTGTMRLACNDWYGNSSGATSGVAMGASDFALNPLFCNLAADLVSLASTSPALNRAGCGLVGALGLGCTTPVSVPPAGGSMGDARLRAFPQPNHGALRFAWVPQGGPTRLEVYDVHGALRYARALGAGEAGLEWSRTDAAGQALPAGVYFARLRDDIGERSACRVVLLH